MQTKRVPIVETPLWAIKLQGQGHSTQGVWSNLFNPTTCCTTQWPPANPQHPLLAPTSCILSTWKDKTSPLTVCQSDYLHIRALTVSYIYLYCTFIARNSILDKECVAVLIRLYKSNGAVLCVAFDFNFSLPYTMTDCTKLGPTL